MPAADRPTRRPIAGLALALAMVGGGCTVEATGVHVTVRTGSCSLDRIDVTVLDGERQLATRTFAAPITDGATFGVRFSDSLDGHTVTIRAAAPAASGGSCSDSREVHVVKQRAVDLELGLGACCPVDRDGGPGDMTDLTDAHRPDLVPPADLAEGDLAVPDLSVPDLYAGDDLAVPDQADLSAGPDLLCVAGCVSGDGGDAGNGVFTVCGGKPQVLGCSFGQCSGSDCPGKNGCAGAGDISVPGTYVGSTAGALSTATGNVCADLGATAAGPDNTFKFSAAQWGTWTLSIDASFPADLFARLICDDATTQMAVSAACGGLSGVSAACSRMAGKASLRFCGLPPSQTYFAVVKDPGGMGGVYQVTSSFTPVDLNTCKGAGMLPGNSFKWSGDTSLQAALNEAPKAVLNCSDNGHAAPDMVFWVPLVDNGTRSILVDVTGKNGFKPLVYVKMFCEENSTSCGTFTDTTASWRLDNAPTGGWYIFVDGQNGSSGQFDLTMTLQ
jgi:hypothetical protein